MNWQTLQVGLLIVAATYSTLWALRNLEGRDIWWALWLTASGVVVGAAWIGGRL